MALEDIPTIPNGTQFTYLNEGAANIVYRIQVTSSPQPSLLEEYGEGTPPPSEIESDIDAGNRNDMDVHTFESKCRSSSSTSAAAPNFVPLSRLVCVTSVNPY